MPKIWPITAVGFPELFVALGIQAVPAGPNWWLSDTVVPISIVDTQVTLAAEAVPVLYNRTDIVNAEVIAPAAGAVIVDSGALAAGDFDVKIWTMAESGTARAGLAIEHRNAANTGNIWAGTVLAFNGSQGQHAEMDFAVTLLANERFRVIARAAFGANQVTSATIFAKRRS